MPIDVLRLALSTGARPVVFLGAGASIESGGRTADAVTRSLLAKVFPESPPSYLDSRFVERHARPATFEHVLDTLGAIAPERQRILLPYFEGMQPSVGYSSLATLLQHDYLYPIVLTTNFDRMLELSLQRPPTTAVRSRVRVLLWSDLLTSTLTVDPDEVVIIKLHGDLLDPKSLRITLAETASLPEACAALVRELFTQHGLIVVGYRARDISVRNALQGVSASAGGLYWITRDSLSPLDDRDTRVLVERHNASGNLITGVTFDDAFGAIGAPLTSVLRRLSATTALDRAWRALDSVRCNSGARRREFKALRGMVAELPSTGLPEADALRALAQHEAAKSETYLLESAVRHLSTSVSEYSGFMSRPEFLWVELRLMEELLGLFLAGGVLGPDRKVHLNDVIERGERLLDDTPPTEITIQCRCLLVLGEAYKERALITNDGDEEAREIGLARATLQRCEELSGRTGPEEGRIIRAASMRHLAVTYELEGDRLHGGQREEAYRTWRTLSETAAAALRGSANERLRAYALMNVASSMTRLAQLAVGHEAKWKLLEEGSRAREESLALLEGVEDLRGVGWAHIHGSEAELETFEISPPTERSRRADCLARARTHAEKAISALRQVGDHLALGMASKQLGVTRLVASRDDPTANAQERQLATIALREAVKQLEAAGYSAATGQAYLYLAECAYDAWRESRRREDLVAAVETMARGIESTAVSLGASDSLDRLFQSLKVELKSML